MLLQLIKISNMAREGDRHICPASQCIDWISLVKE